MQWQCRTIIGKKLKQAIYVRIVQQRMRQICFESFRYDCRFKVPQTALNVINLKKIYYLEK